jgi:hypothetical protein
VSLVAAVGAARGRRRCRFSDEALAAAVALARGLTRERRGLGEFRVLLALDVAALVAIRGDDRARGKLR